MPKIRVEIEVSNDVFRPCETCRYYRQDRFDWGYCYLFEQKISYGHRCDKCKQAEKKNETNQSVKSERHNFVGILGDNSRMCRSVLEAFSDCGTSNIYLHRVDVCGVRRSNGRTEYLVEKTGKGE